MLTWTRAELKSRARTLLTKTYWPSFLGALLVTAITFAAGQLHAGESGFLSSLASAIHILIILPLEAGLAAFFLRNRLAPPDYRVIFSPFTGRRYGPVVASMVWRLLFITLWSLLPVSGFLVLLPGLIQSGVLPFVLEDVTAIFPLYAPSVWAVCGAIFLVGTVVVVSKGISYSLVPFILADNPHIGVRRALRLSIVMTHGYKTRIFLLVLSFIGWIILASIPYGLGLLFLEPYIQATLAELYVVLRANALHNGLCDPQELGLPPMDNQP